MCLLTLSVLLKNLQMETNNTSENEVQPSQTINEHTHNRFEFDEVTIDSCFDSGNLMMAVQLEPGKYGLKTAPDAYKTLYEAKTGTFFHFRISKIDLRGAETRRFEFTIQNMKKVNYNNYMRQGMVPVYKSPSNDGLWRYLPTPLLDKKQVNETDLELTFEYTFNALESKAEVVFCYTFPYSYSDCQTFIKQLEDKYANHHDIYFHREQVTYSLEGRPMELLTITGLDKQIFDERGTAEVEPLLPGLFPNHPKEQTKLSTLENRHLHRPFVWKNKRYIFLTARVHPGEPPANHMLQGLLKNLLDCDNPASKILLENFVYVIIPMLNPDGVYNGYSRTDAKGINWQMTYHLANNNQKEHPGPYAVLEVAKSLNRESKVALSIDLHSHSNKDGGFVFATWHPDFDSRVEIRVFTRLLDIYSFVFDYESSEFGTQAGWEDTDQSKMGIAKTELRKQAGILHAYTLETSFHVTTKDSLRYSIKGNPEKLLNRSEQIRRIDVQDFYEIGESINSATLEMFVGNHPNSKLKKTVVGDIDNIRKRAVEEVRLEDENLQKVTKEKKVQEAELDKDAIKEVNADRTETKL